MRIVRVENTVNSGRKGVKQPITQVFRLVQVSTRKTTGGPIEASFGRGEKLGVPGEAVELLAGHSEAD